MHYRSEHPLLIQFSNKAFYGGRLQCPPTRTPNVGKPPIEMVEVNGTYEKRVNEMEARETVRLLTELWLAHGVTDTIGVVTFNLQQQDRIENLLQEEALRSEPFRHRYETECNRQDGQQDVSFFVKNLESVQGDERDIMIFSTTYGRDSRGQFKRYFGPVNFEGGERRLNVAVTRAKKKIFILTSLPIEEISDIFSVSEHRPGTRVSGRDYLQAYMRYVRAVSTGDTASLVEVQKQAEELGTLAGVPTSTARSVVDADSDFETAVYDELVRKGFTVDTQVGDSGFRIDLAIKDPRDGHGFVLGIECDGRSYHSQFTARARDIWRQQILQGRGWNIHRVWSTNWWLDPEVEIDKIIATVQALSAKLS